MHQREGCKDKSGRPDRKQHVRPLGRWMSSLKRRSGRKLLVIVRWVVGCQRREAEEKAALGGSLNVKIVKPRCGRESCSYSL
eukprot:2464232-Prorocentrum_lima.AAC.1